MLTGVTVEPWGAAASQRQVTAHHGLPLTVYEVNFEGHYSKDRLRVEREEVTRPFWAPFISGQLVII